MNTATETADVESPYAYAALELWDEPQDGSGATSSLRARIERPGILVDEDGIGLTIARVGEKLNVERGKYHVQLHLRPDEVRRIGELLVQLSAHIPALRRVHAEFAAASPELGSACTLG